MHDTNLLFILNSGCKPKFCYNSILFFKVAKCVISQSQALKGVKAKDMVTQMEETLKKYMVKEILLTAEDIYDVDKKQPPRFVTHIQDNMDLVELQDNKFDCQLTPVGDPKMKVEWFFNGRPLPYSKYTLEVQTYSMTAPACLLHFKIL